ncbi:MULTISPECIES: inositol monophosphatase family protein [unclassified Streptomyces]|uniref:inositol monophosphatase family protein n=1 Tax=unclassified Streptomyces TaxID=2593676 RepID=UPI000B50BEF2|nr:MULTISPECIES: inositol monophosphatase family protein [unclassified Streptomyces]MYW99772.1 inositol monophosphatase [Streptomyces sp. SID8378]SNB88418.1 myo-inositol-1(or 4)-monophosphatase [Streptomyces sp. PgraA7]
MSHALDPAALLAVAEEAATGAADELLRRRGSRHEVATKKNDSLVSDADTAAERLVLDVLRERTPGFGVISEEAGAEVLPGAPCWIVDPLDGTTNYLRGLPDYAVALALVDEGTTVLSCVVLPDSGARFTALAGQGAYRDGRRIAVTRQAPGRSLTGTGFGTAGVVREAQRSVADSLLRGGFEIREPGSASVGLCRTACGAYDGYLEFGIEVWDTAPGALLVQEAGGVVTGWGGAPFEPAAGDLIAAAPAVHARLVDAGGARPPARATGGAA